MSKIYSVKEIYYTLQGEGAQTGRPALFCRFSGCNLWSGREEDRHKAECNFCDTDFIGTDGVNGDKFNSPEALAAKCLDIWNTETSRAPSPSIVLTGGEPMLQTTPELIDALHKAGFWIAIESNGTQIVSREIDWICISPKGSTTLVQTFGDELKCVYPQPEQNLDDLLQLDFKNFFLQPMDTKIANENLAGTVAYVKKHPKWRLSLQTHKMIGID